MKNIISLNCPSCGGTLKINEGDKNVLCEYCNSEYVISSKVGIERYYAKPEKGISDYFKERNIKIIESKILFIPILKVKTEIFGWLYAYRKGKTITYQEKDKNGKIRTYTVTINENQIMKPINNYQEYILPLVKRMNIGLERIDLEGIELLPYDDETMHKIGFVMDLSEGIDKVKSNALRNIINRFLNLFSEYDEIKYDLECVLPHFSILYYPVFTARTDVGHFEVDGVRKKVIHREEKKEYEKRIKIRIKAYFIPIFTLIVSFLSIINMFLGFIVFIVFLLLLIYSYGD